MTFGEKIGIARQAKRWTQTKLAEEIGVSTEAVSKWEQNVYRPSDDKLQLLEDKLDLAAFDDEGKLRNMRIFDEDHMSAFLKGKMNSLGMTEAPRALNYAKQAHASSPPRKGAGNVPYINHPLTMACHAFAMGLEDDELLAALLLHDVVEDCGVLPNELPATAEVREIVALVSKPKDRRGFSEKEYYDAIGQNPKACLVKCIDRCNNLSTMATGFTTAKIAEYVEETEAYYPELLRIVKNCPKYNNAAWLLQYQIKALLEAAKRIR